MLEKNRQAAYDPPKNPKRKSNSADPAWKYSFWSDDNHDKVQCTLFGTSFHSGVKRIKQHLIGGFGDATAYPHSTKDIQEEMLTALNSH